MPPCKELVFTKPMAFGNQNRGWKQWNSQKSLNF